MLEKARRSGPGRTKGTRNSTDVQDNKRSQNPLAFDLSCPTAHENLRPGSGALTDIRQPDPDWVNEMPLCGVCERQLRGIVLQPQLALLNRPGR